jgi:hypothetical protein
MVPATPSHWVGRLGGFLQLLRRRVVHDFGVFGGELRGELADSCVDCCARDTVFFGEDGLFFAVGVAADHVLADAVGGAGEFAATVREAGDFGRHCV